MPRQIVIVGGGISGLSVLHYLKQKYPGPDVQIRLLEKNIHPGGTIRTERHNGVLFETGPNGFLANKGGALDLIEELGLTPELLPASEAAGTRYIALQNRLHALPTDPLSLWRFQPLSLFDKLRIPLEIFVPKGNDPNESVFEFGRRRLGPNFAKYFLDPMVSGVFGGDAEQLHLASAFPRIHEIEQAHGSLIKGMFKIRKGKKSKSPAGQPAGRLSSLKQGMSQLIDALYEKYKPLIQTQEEVRCIAKAAKGYVLTTNQADIQANQVFFCTPAYVTAKMLASFNAKLSGFLAQIPYASMAVVGLVYSRTAFAKCPEGFGYLIPSSERREVLGVLFSSQIFPNRAQEDTCLVRVMIGGQRHPQSAQKPQHELLAMADQEIKQTLNVTESPRHHFCTIWPHAIPQYNKEYPQLRKAVVQELRSHPGLHLAANYLNGIAMNDCAKNAKLLVEQSIF